MKFSKLMQEGEAAFGAPWRGGYFHPSLWCITLGVLRLARRETGGSWLIVCGADVSAREPASPLQGELGRAGSRKMGSHGHGELQG